MWKVYPVAYPGYSVCETRNGSRIAHNVFSDCAAAIVPDNLGDNTGYCLCTCTDGIGGHPVLLHSDIYDMWALLL